MSWSSVSDIIAANAGNEIVIGVDAAVLMSSDVQKQSCWRFFGALPRNIISSIDETLGRMKKTFSIKGHKVSFIVVFDGIRAQLESTVVKRTLNEHSTTYKRMNPSKQDEVYSSEESVSVLFKQLVLHFKERKDIDVTFLRAPFSAVLQLSAMSVQSFIQVLYTTQTVAETRGLPSDFVVTDDDGDKCLAYKPDQSKELCIYPKEPKYVFDAKNSFAVTHIADVYPTALKYGYERYDFMVHPSVWLAFTMGAFPAPIVRALAMKKISMQEFVYDSEIYECFKDFLTFNVPLQTQIIYQIADLWRKEEISLEIEDGSPVLRPPRIELDEWRLDEFGPQELENDKWIKKLESLGSKATTDPHVKYSSSTLLTSVPLKLLDLMGYFTHSMNNNEDSGLSLFAQALQDCTKTQVAPAILFIESLRTHTLTAKSYRKDTNQREANQKDDLALYAARVMSLVSLRTGTEAEWGDSKIYPDVSAYTHLARLAFGILQQLNEVLFFTSYAKNDPTGAIDAKVAFQNLLFQEPPTSYMGMVVYDILTTPIESVTDIESLKSRYKIASHLKEDLQAAADFFMLSNDIIEKIAVEDQDILAFSNTIAHPAQKKVIPVLEKIGIKFSARYTKH